MPTIHYAISFGPNCRTRYQLKRVFRGANPSGIFDWQITPPAAAIAYLRSDFAGMFELADLAIDPTTNHVVHRTLATLHMHEFPSDISLDTLRLHYTRARRRHDYLCGKVRKLLQGTSPLLLAMSPSHTTGQTIDIPSLRAALTAYNPRGEFHFMVEPPDGDPLDGDWRGRDAVWDAALSHYRVPLAAKVRAEWQRLLRRPLANLPRPKAA